jgi:hypothetical protein
MQLNTDYMRELIDKVNERIQLAKDTLVENFKKSRMEEEDWVIFNNDSKMLNRLNADELVGSAIVRILRYLGPTARIVFIPNAIEISGTNDDSSGAFIAGIWRQAEMKFTTHT